MSVVCIFIIYNNKCVVDKIYRGHNTCHYYPFKLCVCELSHQLGQ